jgi:2-phosphoglycerate kinase
MSLKRSNKNDACNLVFGQPGYVLHEMIKRITDQDMTANCSCCKKAKELDRKGWLWCISHRNEIRDYMMEQAKKRGFEIDEEKTWKTFAATAMQMIKGRGCNRGDTND